MHSITKASEKKTSRWENDMLKIMLCQPTKGVDFQFNWYLHKVMIKKWALDMGSMLCIEDDRRSTNGQKLICLVSENLY